MKRISLLLILAVAAIAANAQLLWKVSGNGLQKPSFIFGTHHLAPLSVINETPGLNDALEAADALYGEIDMSVLADPSALMSMTSATMAPADSTLSKVMSQADLEALSQMLADYGAPVTVSQLEPSKPAAVSNLISMLMVAKDFPEFNQTQQLDATLQRIAREKGKSVNGLETLQAQIDILFNSPISEQAKSLSEAIAHKDEQAKLAHLMCDAYMAGNIARLHEIMTDASSGMTPEERDRLIDNRNETWVDFLIGIIPTASVIAVVGAGHLPGDKGLISLLRAKGYSVDPVK